MAFIPVEEVQRNRLEVVWGTEEKEARDFFRAE